MTDHCARRKKGFRWRRASDGSTAETQKRNSNSSVILIPRKDEGEQNHQNKSHVGVLSCVLQLSHVGNSKICPLVWGHILLQKASGTHITVQRRCGNVETEQVHENIRSLKPQ